MPRSHPKKPAARPASGDAAAASKGTVKTGSAQAALTAAATETPTTFPPADCAARLPPADVLHEVVFAEIKRLTLTIDSLPFSIVLPPRGAGGDYVNFENAANAGRIKKVSSAPMTALDAYGGVPVERVFQRSLGDLKAPLLKQARVGNPARLLEGGESKINYPGGAARVTLSDDARADLAAGRPTIVVGKSSKGQVLLRLAPEGAPHSLRPLQSLYHVGTADQFIRQPFVAAVDGTRLRVQLGSTQLKALTERGEAVVRLGGQPVQLRTSAPPRPQAQSADAEIVTRPGQGLEGEPQRGTGTADTSSVEVEQPSVPLGQLKLALFLPWRQTWKLLGYSRGEMLHSLALAPQEEVTIEVSSWDRRKRTLEDSAQSEFEQTTEFQDTEKDSQSIVREMSSQNQFGINVGGQVGFKVGVVNVSANTAADARASLNNSSKASVDTMREGVRRASAKLQLQRQTKIGETTETGTEQKVTRKVRNSNLCHTLSLNYYEVLAHYEVSVSFDPAQARLCVLVPNASIRPLGAFDYENVRYYDSVLRRVLLVPALVAGLDAAKKLSALDRLSEARTRNLLHAAVAATISTGGSEMQALIAQAQRVANAFLPLSGSLMISAIPVAPPWAVLVPYPVLTLQLLDKAQFQRWLYLRRARSLEPHLFDVIATLAAGGAVTADGVKTLAEALAGTANLSGLSPSTIAQDQNGLYALLRSAYSIPGPVVFTDIPAEAYAVNDGGVVAALLTFRDQLRAIEEDKEAQKAKDAMAGNQATVQTDYSNKEIAEALEQVDALTHHLNEYANYYRTAIFKLLPWSDAFGNMLTMYAPLVNPEVVGFEGDEVAFPLNHQLNVRLQTLFDELITDNPELIAMTSTQKVTLPTSGVHLEGRLGGCSTCEDYVVQVRRTDLANRRVEVEIKEQTLAQQKLETQRYEKRIEAEEYSDPVTRTPALHIEQETSTAAPKPDPVP